MEQIMSIMGVRNPYRKKLTKVIVAMGFGFLVVYILQNNIVTNRDTITDRERNEPLRRVPLDDQVTQTKVLLLTQSWTDSSLLSAMFAQNPETFLWTEPGFSYQAELYNLTKQKDIALSYMLEDGDVLRPLPEAAQQLQLKAVEQPLNCQTSVMDEKLLLNPYYKQAAGMPRMLPYKDCLHQMAHTQQTHPGLRCKYILHAGCTRSSIVTVKTSHFPVYLIQRLLENDPAVKVIYYVTDPKEVIQSRGKSRKFQQRRVTGSANSLCKKIIQDYVHLRSLNLTFLDNLKLVHSEDLLGEPLETAQQLYSFIGRSFPIAVQRWVKQNTAPSAKGSHPRNDKLESPASRTEWQNEITDSCGMAAQLFGYDQSITNKS